MYTDSDGDKITDADRSRVDEKLTELKSALERQDAEAMATTKAALEAEFHELSKKVYESTTEQPQEAGVGAGEGAGASEDVIDAEFKEDK